LQCRPDSIRNGTGELHVENPFLDFAPAPAFRQADLSNRSYRPLAGRSLPMPAMLAAVAKHWDRQNVAAKCRDVRLTLQKIDSIGNLRLHLCSLP
jgi:hypothetical protein